MFIIVVSRRNFQDTRNGDRDQVQKSLYIDTRPTLRTTVIASIFFWSSWPIVFRFLSLSSIVFRSILILFHFFSLVSRLVQFWLSLSLSFTTITQHHYLAHFVLNRTFLELLTPALPLEPSFYLIAGHWSVLSFIL